MKWTQILCEMVSSRTELFSLGQVPAWLLENTQILFEVVSSSTDWFYLGQAPVDKTFTILKTDDFTLTFLKFIFTLN